VKQSPVAGQISVIALFSKLLGIIVSSYLLVELTVGVLVEDAPTATVLLVEGGTMALLSGTFCLQMAVLPLRRMVATEREATRSREADLRREARRQDLEARLHRAFEMADTEDAAHDIVRRTLQTAVAERPCEMLLADSSDSHLKRSVEVGPDGHGPGCAVVSPNGCPAIRRGQTLLFSSSEELDSCPQLRDRSSGPCSAVCTPINVAGRSIGVLHTIGRPDERPDADTVSHLETLASRGGARIGMLRVMERTSLQAATDPQGSGVIAI
jgi:hypothetical protein